MSDQEMFNLLRDCVPISLRDSAFRYVKLAYMLDAHAQTPNCIPPTKSINDDDGGY